MTVTMTRIAFRDINPGDKVERTHALAVSTLRFEVASVVTSCAPGASYVRAGNGERFYDHPQAQWFRIDVSPDTYVRYRGTENRYRIDVSSDADVRYWVTVNRSVDLPKTPTEGVLEWTAGENTSTPGRVRRVYAAWYVSPEQSGFSRPDRILQVQADGLGLQVPLRSVRSFTPAKVVAADAIVVSQELIDELRRAHDNSRRSISSWHAVETFLMSLDVKADR
jgi:hypothetical protein